ncbi:MAG: serine/threonine-protein kinase [Acidobacteriota bacterium]
MVDPSETATRESPASSNRPREEGFSPGVILADRYRIIALLGRGGMGEVYRADDLRLGQQVSLKFLPPRYEHDAAARERLIAEARNARAVAHPHVCRVYDVGDLAGRLFLTMEYIDGEDLASLLRRIGRLPPAKAQQIARQLCAGLAAAHDRGVLHRDLKPSNVMIDGRGVARITDFGLAVDPVRDGSPADFAGTLAYMAPERTRGDPATVQSDLYALGLVLYEACTGTTAFKAAGVEEWKRAHDRFVPRPPSEVSGDVDPATERAILWCLEKDPHLRPASAGRVAAALPGGDPLQAAIDAGETPSPELVAASGEEGTLSRRSAWLRALGSVASVAAAVGVWSWILLVNVVSFEGSPDVLRAQARRVLRECGLSARGGDSAWWFVEDLEQRQYRMQVESVRERFEGSRDARSSPLSFRYRWHPDTLVPAQVSGLVTTGDPRPETAGDATVHLDAGGRLTFLRIVPPAQVRGSDGAGVSWSPLFAAAGLEASAFRTSEPEWLPGVPFERRFAWSERDADQPLRVEAAEAEGRPVSFRVIRPWSLPTFDPGERHSPASAGLAAAALAIGWMVTVAMLAALARRNLRFGRGDRRGAVRVSASVLALLGVATLTGRHWASSPGSVWDVLSRGLGYPLFAAAMIWLYYLGFEPFVRRRWPRLLIAWTRLLSGRWRDPLVGQSILAGVAIGGALALIGALPEAAGRALDLSRAVPFYSPESLNGFWRYGASLSEALVNGIRMGFGLVALMLVVRMGTANDWIIRGAAVAAAATAAISGAEPVVLDVVQAVVIGVVALVTLRALGLLTLSSAVAVNYLIRFTPWTFDTTAWFVWRQGLTTALIVALTAWGFVNVLGRQSAFPGGGKS